MSIEIVKNIKEANCVTHGGTFHADDVFATVILSKIMPEIRIIRLLEVTEQMPENVIIYDIGAGKFDHHQFGGNGEREGVKYAAFGCILTLISFFSRLYMRKMRISWKDVLKAILLSGFELIGLRFILMIVRMNALIGYRKYKDTWGTLERKKLNRE